jgi:hypothetical protein
MSKQPSIDWTGVKPDSSPIPALNETTFIERLKRLSERATSIALLRSAFNQQNLHGDQLSSDPKQSPRQQH